MVFLVLYFFFIVFLVFLLSFLVAKNNYQKIDMTIVIELEDTTEYTTEYFEFLKKLDEYYYIIT